MLIILLLLAACGAAPTTQPPTEPPTSPTAAPVAESTPASTAAAGGQVLRLATTTSTADSGLLDAILPAFEAQSGATVEVIAVGTGQALKLGASGDVDVVLVHDRAREDAFVAAGDGVNRRAVMYNDFVIVGPPSDPATIAAAASAAEAFRAIADSEAIFTSRGDESGTYSKEQAIWAAAAITPTQELVWYRSLGQGMSETLITANELGAYCLVDRGTWLATRENLPELTILFGGETIAANPDQTLYNPYGVIPVNPAKHPGINDELAEQFAAWLTSHATQAAIGVYGKKRFGQALFYPAATP